MRIRKTTWNTYRVSGYNYSIANDQASAGGVILHQVRRTKDGHWQAYRDYHDALKALSSTRR